MPCNRKLPHSSTLAHYILLGNCRTLWVKNEQAAYILATKREWGIKVA